MGKYIKTFNTESEHQAYTAYTNDNYIEPYISLTEDDFEVHYNRSSAVICTYNVTDDSTATQICYYSSSHEVPVDNFTVAYIDGVETSISEIREADGNIQLSVGEHTIIFVLKDPSVIEEYIFGYSLCLTSVIIPDTVTTIKEYAFDTCRNLVNVTLSNNLTTLKEGVFSQCENLPTITLPNSLTNIGDIAFLFCENLTEIIIPESVTTIGGAAFRGCYKITNMHIPAGVTSIGEMVLSECNSITSITVDLQNPNYDSRNNCNALIETSTNNLINGCRTTVIPNDVVTIGRGAFRGQSSLTSIFLPNSIISIDYMAFEYCNSLTTINIPNGIVNISGTTFSNCSSLASIIIPESITNIETNAFGRCSALTSIISLSSTAPTITSQTFRSIASNGTLTVPAGATGYDVWMGTGNYYLGKYNWTKVEQQ